MLRPGSVPAKIAALAILGILLLATHQLVIEPLTRTYQNNRDHIARNSKLLLRYRALAAERPVLAEQLAAFQEDSGTGAGYLEGPSDGLAAAELQERVSDAIDEADGEIKSMQILPASDVENGLPFRRTGLKARISASIDELAEALYDLEVNEPHLFIDEILVVAGRSRSRQDKTVTDPVLDIRMNVLGYARKED